MNSSGEDSAPRRKLTAERRVVTILFSDVKGSNAMAENLDPEDWTEIMNEASDYLIQPIIRYGGNIARLMGDAILTSIGAPTAHEDDPLRAVLVSTTFSPSAMSDHISDADLRRKFLNLPRVSRSK